jgi:DNA polymerase IIIc chi subunit
MINLASEVTIYINHFERVAEIVEFDEAAKKNARTRYKHYQGEGFNIQTHTLEL